SDERADPLHTLPQARHFLLSPHKDPPPHSNRAGLLDARWRSDESLVRMCCLAGFGHPQRLPTRTNTVSYRLPTGPTANRANETVAGDVRRRNWTARRNPPPHVSVDSA